QRGAVTTVGQLPQVVHHRLWPDVDRPQGLAELVLDGAFEGGTDPEDGRGPLPAVIDAVEARVVQLVAAVEGQLTVVVGGDQASVVPAQIAGPARQGVEETLGDRAPGPGQRCPVPGTERGRAGHAARTASTAARRFRELRAARR